MYGGRQFVFKLTFLKYMSTNDGRSDLGFHPPNNEPLKVLPDRSKA